jgi:hypothetical protein
MARLLSARTLVLGGLAIAAAAGIAKNRGKVAGLIGARSSAPEPYPRPSEAPVGTAAAEPGPAPAPAISNADAAGPPANTATHVPAPEPQVHEPAGGIDEQAEEAAAAAEAANIGGPAPDYEPEDPAAELDPADIPLEEAGEGVSEGQELAEADLVENVAPTAGDPDPAARRLEDTIEAQDDPSAGETVEMEAPAPDPADASEGAAETGTLAPETVEDGAATGGGTLSGETSAAEKSANVWRAPESGEDDEDDGGSEWQTWSGRAVEP